MGSFTASLRTLGDRRGMPVVVNLGNGRLSISLGETELGDWLLEEVSLEPMPTGYRLSAEGDHILLEMKDSAAFDAELAGSIKKRKTRRTGKTGRPSVPGENTRNRSAPGTASPREPVAAIPDAKSNGSKTSSKGPKSPAHAGPSMTDRVMGTVDRWLNAAEKRWGAVLPQWAFTRFMFGVVTAALILMLVFPGWLSPLLLISGVLLVLLGAVLYTDQVLTAKWLPGRMTPMHVLLFGVAILLLGVLLGVIAR